MKFRVTIKKPGIKDEVKIMDAESRFDIYKKVHQEGGTVIALTNTVLWFDPSRLNIKFGSGIKKRQVIVFTKNLAAMLSAGLSLSRALSVAERQSNNKNLKSLVSLLTLAINKGKSFHEALEEHLDVFSRLYISMAMAGEESGALSEALATIASQMERSEALTRKIKGAMIYPAIVITAIVIVGILMLEFVVPTLTATFKSLGVQLPLGTRIIVALSEFVVNNVFLMLFAIAAIVIGAISFFRSRPGKNALTRISLHLPVIGELVRETFAARASRTLASLLSSGVNVLTSISITKDVLSVPLFANVLHEAEERVKKGDLLSAAFVERPKLYPIMMSDMIAIGEETGKLSEMLGQVAAFYEEDVQEKTKDLSTIIEPILMLLIGVVVGVFAVSIISPIYSLSSAI